MKVYINKYRYHWLSPYTILDKVFFWREIDYDEPLIDKWSNRLVPICEAFQKFLDTIHPKIDYVKIDYWDTWGMDSTLAPIILPMLKQLRETKHGSAIVDLEDVPEHLRTTGTQEYHDQLVFDFYKEDNTYKDDYPNIHARWEWVLDEMIWAFEQKADDKSEDQFFDHPENYKDNFPWNRKGEYVSRTNVDWNGLKSWQKRKENGFRLFGKYYEGLWD